MANKQRQLIIFIKNPRLGLVKTRLAASVGNHLALEVYRALLVNVQTQTKGLPVRKLLYYSEFIDHDDEWEELHYEKYIQSGETLGRRMGHAFQDAFRLCAAPTIIIGSDCPSISQPALQQAFDALDHYDMVIGPAHDGGYYLLGLHQYHESLFEGILWSTDRVLQQSLDAAEALNLRYHLLPVRRDLDTVEDLRVSNLAYLLKGG